MLQDEFRVEIDLDADHDGMSLGERFRAFDLDDEARERLAGKVIVTRDGSKLFLYAASRQSAAEAERVARELLAGDGIEAAVATTRWHPVAAEWKDADLPLPEEDEAIQAEAREHERRRAEEGDPPDRKPEFVLLDSYTPGFLRDLGL